MNSVIILSYNTQDITLKCLDHLYKSKDVELEVIVIDNASSDNSVKAIKKEFPQVKLIANKENVGFAAGNNQGMKLAKGETILLLNSDCFVQTETLATCTKFLNQFDVLGCKLLNKDGSIQPSWGYFPSLWRIVMLMSFVDNFPLLRKFIRSIHVRDISRYRHTQEVDWITGAFTLLKAQVFKIVGGIDEKYFMYGEETEWMYRIKQAGYRVGFVADAVATHLKGASTQSLSRAFTSEMKGYLYWFKKYEPAWKLPMLKLTLAAGSLYKIVAWTILGKILGKSHIATAHIETLTELLKTIK